MPQPESVDAAAGNLVADWFGASFERLHPLLQALHREGGRLHGDIDIAVGRGLAGVVGRRLARKLGIPLGHARRGFEVRISHDAEAMHWIRSFDDGSVLASTFRPLGRYPDGAWIERSGPVTMRLGVDLDGGGWRWRLLGLRVFGLPLPRWPLRVDAFKRVEGDGRYRFGVAFSMAMLGPLLRYEGVLQASPATPDGPSARIRR